MFFIIRPADNPSSGCLQPSRMLSPSSNRRSSYKFSQWPLFINPAGWVSDTYVASFLLTEVSNFISFICPGTQVFGTASVVVSNALCSLLATITSSPVGGHWSAVAVFEGPSLLVCLFLFWNGLFAEFFFAVVRPRISRRNSRLMWTLRSTTILFTDWGHMPDYFISDIP